MIVTSIVLAIIAAVIDHFIGIKDPWRMFIYIAILILFGLGLLVFFVPGLIPLRLGVV